MNLNAALIVDQNEPYLTFLNNKVLLLISESLVVLKNFVSQHINFILFNNDIILVRVIFLIGHIQFERRTAFSTIMNFL